MWIALGLVQVLVDAVLLVVAAIWYKAYRREKAERDRVTACLNVLESHGARNAQEWTALRGQLQEQLRVLHSICEEAKGILTQGSVVGVSDNSREARELQQAWAPAEIPLAPVPTVADLQTSQISAKPQGWLDLKTLLREQLV